MEVPWLLKAPELGVAQESNPCKRVSSTGIADEVGGWKDNTFYQKRHFSDVN